MSKLFERILHEENERQQLRELKSTDYAKFINKETGLYDAVETGEKLKLDPNSVKKVVHQMSQPGQSGFELRKGTTAKPVISNEEAAAKAAVNMMIDTRNALKTEVVGAKAEPYLNSSRMLGVFKQAAKVGAAGLAGESVQAEDPMVAQQIGAKSQQAKEAAKIAGEIWNKQYPNTPGK